MKHAWKSVLVIKIITSEMLNLYGAVGLFGFPTSNGNCVFSFLGKRDKI